MKSKDFFIMAVPGIIMGFVSCFLVNTFILPLPLNALNNGINNGISGGVSTIAAFVMAYVANKKKFNYN